MKKLMIAAAIVCAAALSQAASFDWTTSGKAYGPDVDFANLEEGHVGISSTYMKTLGDMTGDYKIAWQFEMTLTDAAGKGDPIKGAVDNYSSNKIKIVNLSSDKIYNPATDEDPACAGAYSIIIKGDYTDAKGNVWTFTADEIKGEYSFGKTAELKITSAAPAGWTVTTTAVPEPTSGLLLILGVAGLALKRRRA